MGEKKEEVKYVPVLTAKFLAFTIALSIAFSIIGMVNDLFIGIYKYMFTFGQWWHAFSGGAMIFLTLMFLSSLVMSKAGRKLGLSVQQLTALYSALSVVAVVSGYGGMWAWPMQWAGLRIPETGSGRWFGKWTPWWWAPEEPVVRKMFMGGVALPAEWGIPILWWMVWLFMMYFVYNSLILLFRERWVEEERLPFPYAVLFNTVLREATGFEKEAGRGKYLLIGVIVGFVAFIPWMLKIMYPWFPSIYGWERAPYNPTWPGCLDIMLVFPPLQAAQIATGWISLSPMWFFMMYFLPLETQLSGFVWWVIFTLILPPIVVAAGLTPAGGPWTSGWAPHGYFRLRPPLYLSAFSEVGVLWGLFLWPLIIAWRPYVASIKRLFKPKTPEEEAKRPLPGYLILLMLIVGLVGMWLMMVASGGSPLIFAGWVGLFTIYMLANLKMRMEMGWYFEHGYSVMGVFYWTLFPGYTDARMDTNFAIHAPLLHSTLHRLGHGSTTGPAFYTLDAYKLGFENGISPREVFKSTFIGRVVGICLSLPLALILAYHFGLYKTPGGAATFGCGAAVATPPSSAAANISLFGDAGWQPAALAGFLFSGLLTFLRARFVWWPLNAVGVIIGAGGLSGLTALGTACGWAFLVKYLTIKIGGAKANDRIVAPFIAGFAGGYALIILSGMVVLLMRGLGI